jgi:8-oxo-dGTP diphosphatase
MKNTTLCYIESGDSWLMLHRDRKPNDENAGKWIGVGGKLESGESPDDCVRRETLEETGLTLLKPRLRGIVTFVSDRWEQELMFLYTASAFSGTLTDCDEGALEWVKKSRVPSLPLWEGDKIFLNLIETDATPFFSLKLRYEGETLAEAALNGEPLPRFPMRKGSLV